MEVFSQFPTLQAVKEHHPDLRGVLFDMDGTLFQTEELHADILRQMAIDMNIRPPFPAHEVEARLKGMADKQVFEQAKFWPGFPQNLSADSFIEDKNSRLLTRIPVLPLEHWCAREMLSFLQHCRDEKLILGLVTSSERVITQALLEASRTHHLFDHIITLQDVKHAKPHPWPYLQAMQHLGLGPRETLIFEDSAPGLEAARKSGARVIEAKWWNR